MRQAASRILALLLLAACPAARGQATRPTTQPTTQPTVAPEPANWTPGTVLEAGGTYYLPRGVGVSIVVEVPDVTFYGGSVWPAGGAGVYFKPGGDGGRVIGTRFHYPGGAPAGAKVPNLSTCVLTYAKGTEVRGCVFGTVNECVRAMPGSAGLVVSGCVDERADIRSAWVYLAGVRGALLSGNTFLDSATENGFRTSPQQMPDGTVAVSENVVIRDNDLDNPGNKNAIDARHVRNIWIEHNRLRNDNGASPAVRLGDSSLPGCVNATVRDNDFDRGQLHAKAQSSGVAEGNRFYGVDPLKTTPLNFDPASGVAPRDNVAYTVGPVPAKAKKLPGPGANNRWEELGK